MNFTKQGSVYPVLVAGVNFKCPNCWGSKYEPGSTKKCTVCPGSSGVFPEWQLSKYFRLSEVLKSDLAIRKGIPNVPSVEVVHNLSDLCVNVLDKVREKVGPISVNSGYRGKQLNAAVGGASSSAHMVGCAIDFVPATPGVTLKKVMEVILDKATGLNYDQVIYEGTWVHIGSLSPTKTKRMQKLMMFPVNGKPKYYEFDAKDPRVI